MRLSTKNLMLISLFTALMAAGAFIRIPFPLLPVTLQTFFCALAGLIIGPRLGALSMTVYAALGLAGVPIFTQGGGLTYVFNGTFGFIPGFIAGAYIIGKLSLRNKKHSKINNIFAAMAGLAVIYATGTAYMLIILRVYLGNTQIDFIYILTANLPYIIKDTILFIIAAIASTNITPALSGAIAR